MCKLLGVSFLAAASLLTLRPMTLVSAGDIPYPAASVADGVVLLRVATDRTGKINGTSALRDIPSLTDAATTSVQRWKFGAASRENGPVESAMTVAVIFRPAVVQAAPPVFQAVHPTMESGYTPAGILAVSYPEYPVNGVAFGTVVLQVAVDESGRAIAIETMRGITGLTMYATRAARTWRFEAAKLNGKPVASRVAIAFVFRLPITTP
jgi:hypothetical protein